MSEPIDFGVMLSRSRHLLLPLILTALVAFIVHPIALIVLLLAQPLVSAALARMQGHLQHEPIMVTWLRRCTAMFTLLVAYSAVVAFLVGAPLVALIRQGTPLNAFLLSGGVMLSVVCLWRVWPSFGLPLLWDDAFPHEDDGSWIFGALHRSMSYALHLTKTRDVFFARGLPVALLILLLVAGAMAIAGFGSVLPSELRILALIIFGLVFSPFAHWVLLNRTQRVLDSAPLESAPMMTNEVTPLIAPIALTPLPSGDPASLNTQLYQAVAAHQTELALSLLEHGADASALPNVVDRDQRTLLMLAATHNDVRLLRALIARGADVNQAVHGLTPLLCATRDSHQGRADAVLTLVSNGAGHL